MRGRRLLLLTAGVALLAGFASQARPDPYQCRAQVRTALGIAPYEGHLVPGFWVKVHECIYKAEHHDLKNAASDKPHHTRRKKITLGPRPPVAPTPSKPISGPADPSTTTVPHPNRGNQPPASNVTVTVIAPSAHSGGGLNPTELPISQLKRVTSDLEGQTKLLTSLIAELRADRSRKESPSDLVQLTLKLVEQRLNTVEKEKTDTKLQPPLSNASVHPDDQTSYPTARTVSETYPLVRYYISGTNEVGNIWVLPTVSDAGQLQFKIRFLDPDAPTDKTRSEAILNLAQVDQMAGGLAKLYRWSQIAHQERIRREYEKRVECFPAADCPDGDKRVDGKSSTELLFHVSDEGATNGVFRRNKGQYVENFSLSMESVAMLWCYMHHVINEGELEYKAGSQTKENLDQLFK